MAQTPKPFNSSHPTVYVGKFEKPANQRLARPEPTNEKHAH